MHREPPPSPEKPVGTRICTAEEVQSLDRRSVTQFNISSERLMENAGRAAARVILDSLKRGLKYHAFVYAGKGGNAGDAFVVAKGLAAIGQTVTLICLENETEYRDATLRKWRALETLPIEIIQVSSSIDLPPLVTRVDEQGLIIDGLLGTGLKGAPKSLYLSAIEQINAKAATWPVFALDIPSGVNADFGTIEAAAVKARVTITFGFSKRGHFLPPGMSHCGKLCVVDIDYPPELTTGGGAYQIEPPDVRDLVLPRSPFGFKNTFGHALVIGGSEGKVGAAALAATAAHRAGAGLVTASTWPNCMDALSVKVRLTTMCEALPATVKRTWLESLGRYASVAVGPGLGVTRQSRQLVSQLIENYSGPLVLDADALTLIAQHDLMAQLKKRESPAILTPHPGEAARLLGIPTADVVANGFSTSAELARRSGSIALVKGSTTFVAEGDRPVAAIRAPNDGMAKAGSGDILTGLICGLLAQGQSAYSAVLIGVTLHQLAGHYAARKIGTRAMIASDLLRWTPLAWQDLAPGERP